MASFRENMSGVRGVWSYLRKHWSGGFSLGFAYGLNGVLLSLLYLSFDDLLRLNIIPVSEAAWPRVSIAMLVLWVLLSIWQIIGIWRSASLHVARGGERRWVLPARISVILWTVGVALDVKQSLPEIASFFSS